MVTTASDSNGWSRMERASTVMAERIAEHARMGQNDSSCYPVTINKAVSYLSDAVFWLARQQLSGNRSAEIDDGVCSVLDSSITTLKEFKDSVSGSEENTVTADRLSDLKKTLTDGLADMFPRPPVRWRRWVFPEAIKAHVKGDKYDLAINDAIVYLAEMYVQLRATKTSDLAEKRISELFESTDTIAIAFDCISETETGNGLAEHDKKTAAQIRASVLRRKE